MKLTTRHFGEIEIDKKKILTFADGIPGFEHLTQFAIIHNPDKELHFHWLQSMEDGDIAFIIVNPFIFKPDYDFQIPKRAIEKLAIEKPEDIFICTIVVVPEDISKMTANLQAPIVINIKNNKGKQIIIDNDNYSRKHPIFQELKNTPKKENVGGPK